MTLSFAQLALRAGLLAALSTPALHTEQNPAYAALMHGRVAEATGLLRQQLAANAADGQAHLLLCRAAIAQDQNDEAVQECQAAAQAQPDDSDTQMWLGRALGHKASSSNPISAFSLAKRVGAAFQRAVQLDPNNYYAANDLGEFYIGAPGMVGGGPDKAAQLANQLMPRAPQQAHRLLALVAEKKDDLTTAETELKAEVAVAQAPTAYIDLALLYHDHHRPAECAAVVDQALTADRRHSPVQVDAAGMLTDLHLNPRLAEQALRAYLASAAQDDSAPVFKVHLQLGQLLAKRGDKAGAKTEYAAAVALAPSFKPAQKALAAA